MGLETNLCREPGSNWRPLPLQGNALPTELSRQTHFNFNILSKQALQGKSRVFSY